MKISQINIFRFTSRIEKIRTYCLVRVMVLAILLLGLSLNATVFAQNEGVLQHELFQTSLDKVLESVESGNNEVITPIATQTNIPIRETPGIVTVISREEIESTGARDLMEILRLVPGIDFGSDVQNVIGISLRGNWAFEGKALITLDGQMINETAYGSFSFAHRILAETIEKVEIIRGPGSAIYGGVAGLAVINIVTRKGKDIQGFNSSHEISFANGLSRQSTHFRIGDMVSKGLSFSLAGGVTEAKLTNRKMLDFVQNFNDYRDSTNIKSYFLNANLQYKNFSLNYYFNDHRSDIIAAEGQTAFIGHYLNANYNYIINKSLRLVPQLQYTRQSPWGLLNVPENDYNLINSRYTGSLQLFNEPTSYFSLVSGIEAFHDNSLASTPLSVTIFTETEPLISYNTFAAYQQAIIKTRPVNLTLGLRMDHNSIFGTALAPRLGVTRVLDKWHMKLLYSNAFKAPTLLNVESNPDIVPERIHTTEFEIGYQMAPSISITANLFNINIKNIILYDHISYVTDHYINGASGGSKGAEVTFNTKFKRATLKGNYSCYLSSNGEVKENPEENLWWPPGFPSHKGVIQVSYQATRFFSLYSNAIYLSNRYTYRLNAQPERLDLPSSLVSNINLKYHNLLFNGLDFNLGVNNLFNSKNYLILAYLGENYPIPSQQREFTARLSYAFNK